MEDSSHKALIAEVAGYLGGAFILGAVITLINKHFDDFSRETKTGLFAVLAISLFVIAHILGTQTPIKSRLSSVLGVGSAVSTSGGMVMYFEMNDPPMKAFVAGALVANYFFFRNRNELLHLAAAGYLFISSVTISATVTQATEDGRNLRLASVIWLALASIWMYLALNGYIQRLLGLVLSSGLLFMGCQMLFIQNLHAMSYIVSLIVVVILAKLFLVERAWPMLVSAILIITFSVAEIIAETLGGSIGAIAGLFIAGAILISTSLYAIRTLNQPHRS